MHVRYILDSHFHMETICYSRKAISHAQKLILVVRRHRSLSSRRLYRRWMMWDWNKWTVRRWVATLSGAIASIAGTSHCSILVDYTCKSLSDTCTVGRHTKSDLYNWLNTRQSPPDKRLFNKSKQSLIEYGIRPTTELWFFNYSSWQYTH